MLDHIGIIISDISASKKWYELALNPIGYAVLEEHTKEETKTTHVAGIGDTETGKTELWLSEATISSPVNNPKVHIAFEAKTREQVDEFHKKAIAAGGKDNGIPQERPYYHPNYYGAFVLDLDGHNIEVVCRN